MEFLFSYELIFVLITLTFLEIILGIDNIIFIAITVHKLPEAYRRKARYIGIALALIMRVIMLFGLSWVLGMTEPLFHIFDLGFSFKNILLILGGLFLLIKSGLEIYKDVSGANHVEQDNKEKPGSKLAKMGFFGAVAQITLIDFVFSFDSIITAIGITSNIPVIVIAVVISMIVMLVAANGISKMLHMYPSLKIMALAFIFMIGVILLADGLHLEISKTYLYFSLFFSIAIEVLNILARRHSQERKW